MSTLSVDGDGLSVAQRRVVRLFLASPDATNPQLAEALGLTVNTVKIHMKRSFKKLGVRGRADLAATYMLTSHGQIVLRKTRNSSTTEGSAAEDDLAVLITRLIEDGSLLRLEDFYQLLVKLANPKGVIGPYPTVMAMVGQSLQTRRISPGPASFYLGILSHIGIVSLDKGPVRVLVAESLEKALLKSDFLRRNRGPALATARELAVIHQALSQVQAILGRAIYVVV